jgi:2-polyprenyl-3-methyl-5-hydroxy-6-metoxy-1,4-benzoquinol methylase
MDNPTPPPTDTKNPEYIEKIRQQYESLPYPHKKLDEHPRDIDPNLDQFFMHSLPTAYYLRNQKVSDTAGKVILDAGCGSGYKALRLAEANPGAKIVGVDISPESVRWARQRLEYHGIEQFEFHAMYLEDLPSLGIEFDYINCDEVLYLLPSPVEGLKAMKSVLKPDGIMRTNLHSALQREMFFRAQDLFKLMGLMDDNPGDMELSVVQETMKSLKDHIDLKVRTWYKDCEGDDAPQHVFMNHLLQGDRGFTIPQMFEMLNAADLEFISMVMWRNWELTSLFKDPEDLPPLWAMSLPNLSDEERLRIFELLHPRNRLLDFWCAQPRQTEEPKPLGIWTPEEWQNALVHLHPLLKKTEIREEAVKCVSERKPFDISKHIFLSTFTPINIDSSVMAGLLPLWDKPQSMMSLVDHWLKIYPIDLITLEPTSEESAFNHLKDWISKLEVFLYLMVEQPQ